MAKYRVKDGGTYWCPKTSTLFGEGAVVDVEGDAGGVLEPVEAEAPAKAAKAGKAKANEADELLGV